MNDLSPRQQQLLDYIRDHIDLHQIAPSYEELKEALGFSSKSHVDYHLNALEAKGCIKRTRGIARGIRLPQQRTQSMTALPIYGYVGASLPVWSASQSDMPDEVIMVTPDIVPPDNTLYGLRVRGDSMIHALVHDGDIVVMRPCSGQPVRDGEMVAVRLLSSDETTLKHFHRDKQDRTRIYLKPANPNYPVIEAPADDIDIQGRVVAVIRQY